MSDGAMTHREAVNNFAYMPRLESGQIQVSRPGACDPDMKQLLARLVPWRFATVAFRWTRVAGNALAITRSQFQIFNNGSGEAGASAGYAGAMTGSETNAVEQGGLVPSGTRFYTVGAWAQFEAPYTVAVGGDAAGDRVYNTNLSLLDGGYSQRLVKCLSDSTYAEINHGTGNACRYSLGPAGLWLNGVGDGSQAFNTNGGLPGQFFWLSTPDESTGKNEDGALRMTVDVTHNMSVEENGANPTTANRDVITPLKVVLMGFPLCEPGSGGGGDVGMMDQLIARMAERGLLPSGK